MGEVVVMVRIAIVEDQDEEAKQLEGYIRRYGKEKNEEFSIKRFSDGLEFVENYEPRFDIIFMDINMPMMGGLSAAKRLRIVDPEVCLIFATRLAQYALNGYEVGARDYLLKPVTYGSFAFRFDKAMAAMKNNRHRTLLLKTRSGISRIDADSIRYIEVNTHLLIYHTTRGDLESWESLKSAEEKLGDLVGRQFVRCNNCFLVNLHYVNKVDGDILWVGDDQLKMSRMRKKNFLNMLTIFFEGRD